MFDSMLRKNGQRACISVRSARPASAPPRLLGKPRVDGEAEAVPARQHQPALPPAEHPRDRAEILDARRRRARCRPAADVEARDFGDRRGRPKVVDEARRLVDERAIGGVRVLRQRVHRAVVGGGTILEPLAVDEARLERGGDERLQVAPAEIGIRILAGDDLALLGDAQAAADAARRLREDRLEARPAAAADGAAAAVEEPQLDAVVAKRVDERQLRAVERPVGRQVAAVLVAVGVAQHHFLPAVAAFEPAAIERQRERGAHDRRPSARDRRSSRTAARC